MTKKEIQQTYQRLQKERRYWWNILTQENILVKTIIGAFVLYMGYVFVRSMEAEVLILLYTISVVGVLWYWLDLLRQLREKNIKKYEQQKTALRKKASDWLVTNLIQENPTIAPFAKRQMHFPQTFLPYIWGTGPESIRQTDYFTLDGVDVSIIQVDQEEESQAYWFLTADLKQKFPKASTALLPRPYQHDKWQKIAFNEAIETPAFRKDYSIFSSEFMHAYYLISADLIRRFLDIEEGDKWMVFTQNKVGLVVAKNTEKWSLDDLDAAQEKMLKILISSRRFVSFIRSIEKNIG